MSIVKDFITRYGVLIQGSNFVTSSTNQIGALQVDGGAAIAKNLIVGDSVEVWGNTTFNKNVLVTGRSTITNNLTVNSLNISGAVTASGSFTALSNSNLNSLLVQGPATLTNMLSVAGPATFVGSLTANTSTFLGPVNVNNTLIITGQTTITNKLSVDSLNVAGILVAQGGISISGNTVLTSLVVQDFTTLSNTLSVLGPATFVGSLTANTSTFLGPVTLNDTLNANNIAFFNNTSLATLSPSGSVVVAGGAYIAKNLIVNSTASNTSTNILNALYVSGGTWIDKNLTVAGNALFQGNVIFSGTSTYVYSTNTYVTDNIVNIHVPSNGIDIPWTFDDGKDIGIKFHYYTNNTNTNAALVLANNTKYLEWYNSGVEGNNTFNGASYGTFKTGSILLTNSDIATTVTSGALQVSGGISAGNIYLSGNASAATVNARNLTAGRIVVAGPNGQLTDDIDLTYDVLTNLLTTDVTKATTATNIANGGPGQLVYQLNVGITRFVATGTTGFILQSNGTSAPTWIPSSGLTSGISTTSTNLSGGTAGQLLYQSAPGITTFMGPGNVGQLLQSGSTSGPTYVNTGNVYVGRSIYADGIGGGTLGAIPIQTGPNTTSFINSGTTGQILLSLGNTATWYNTATLIVGFSNNLIGGQAGQLVYQSSTSTTSFVPLGNIGDVLVSNGNNSPVFQNTLTLSGTTNSLNTYSGTFVVGGGVGIGKDLYVGGIIYGTLLGSITGNAASVSTVQRVSLTPHYLTFVDSNNTSTSAENIYTTSSFTIIPSSGNVGIGTSTPTALLEVIGTTKIVGITELTNPSNSISINSGALQVTGGVGIGANLYVGGNTNITGNTNIGGVTTVTNSSNSISVNSGALQVTGGVGIGANLYVGGNTNIGGVTTITNVSNSISTNSGALQVTGGAGIGANLYVGGNTNVNGIATVANVLNSISTNSGALQVTGGAGIGANLYVGGNTNINGITTVTNTLNASSTTTGALVVAGGVGIAKDLYVGGQIIAQKLTIEYTTITTLVVQTDDIIQTTNQTNAVSTTTGALQIAGGAGFGGDIYVGGTIYGAINGSISGAAAQVVTVSQTENNSYYLTFVNSNNASPVGESIYTTSSFVINPNTGNVGIGTSTVSITGLTIEGDNGSVHVQTKSDPLNYYAGLRSNNNFAEVVTLYAKGSGLEHNLLSWGDTAGLLVNGGNGPLQLKTSSTTHLLIDTSGNVGIGTNLPGYKLDVNGVARFIGSNLNRPVTIDAGVTIKGNTGSWALQYQFQGSVGTNAGGFGASGTDDAVNYYYIGSAYDSQQFVLTSSGNVGIGTNAPTATLYVTTATGTAIFGTTAGVTEYGGQFQNSNNSQLYFVNLAGAGTNGILSAGNTSTTFLMLDSSGNLGLNTVLPNYLLDVKGQVGLSDDFGSRPAIKLSNWGSSNSYKVLIIGSTSTVYNTNVTGSTTIAVNYDPNVNSNNSFNGDGREVIFRNGIQFVTPNDANTTWNLYNLVLKDGNVGIGTANPTAKLDINSGTIQLSQGYDVRWGVYSDGVSGSRITGGAAQQVAIYTSGTERMQITALGGLAFGGSGNYGTIGQILLSNGNAVPSWSDVSGISVGSTAQVQTINQLSNSTYYLTFVDSNNASSTAESIYTTSSFTINPSNGNVGIGTVDNDLPITKLDVNGPTRIRSDFYVYGAGDRLNIFPQTAGNGTNLVSTNNTNSNYAPMLLEGSRIVFNISGGEQMRFTSNGGLSFGGASNFGTVGYLLKSNGDATPSWFDPATLNVGTASKIQTNSQNINSNYFITFVDSNNLTPAEESVYTTSSFTINPGTGNVGIGTSSPTNRLQVEGTVKITDTTTITTTTNAVSTTTGALQVAGGIGVGGSIYIGNRVGWVNNSNNSAVYQIYNAATNSLDTVFA